MNYNDYYGKDAVDMLSRHHDEAQRRDITKQSKSTLNRSTTTSFSKRKYAVEPSSSKPTTLKRSNKRPSKNLGLRLAALIAAGVLTYAAYEHFKSPNIQISDYPTESISEEVKNQYGEDSNLYVQYMNISDDLKGLEAQKNPDSDSLKNCADDVSDYLLSQTKTEIARAYDSQNNNNQSTQIVINAHPDMSTGKYSNQVFISTFFGSTPKTYYIQDNSNIEDTVADIVQIQNGNYKNLAEIFYQDTYDLATNPVTLNDNHIDSSRKISKADVLEAITSQQTLSTPQSSKDDHSDLDR